MKEEFRKSGYFWLPSNPERKISGVLVIMDGGKIELDVEGLFDESPQGINKALNSKHNIERIMGSVQGDGFVTLDNCFCKRWIFSNGISRASFFVHQAFVGVAYDEKEKCFFNKFKFSVEGIDEWVGISGIVSEFQEKIVPTVSITYAQPEEILINLNNGMSLVVSFSWAFSGGAIFWKEARITQKTYFELVSEQERPLNEFVSVSHKIVTLLCFAIDETVCIEEVSATSNSISRNLGSGEKKPIPISIYYASQLYAKNNPKIDIDKMLFTFEQIQKDAERIFNNWLSAYDTFSPTLNLYFSVKTGAHEYLDSKFLALVQGLETYHRRISDKKIMDDDFFEELKNKLISQCPEENKKWLEGRLQYGNELSLARRMKMMIEPFKGFFGNSEVRSKLIRDIVNTRNYLTHYDKSLESVSIRGGDLYWIFLKMEVLFQLHLLDVLGFSESEIDSILKGSYKLQQKIRGRE